MTGPLVVNTNAAALPAPPGGATTLLQLGAVDTSIALLVIDTFGGGSGTASQFRARKARGTAAARTPVQANDTLGYLVFDGYGATAYGTGANLNVAASENWSDTAHGSAFFFQTTPNGATTNSVVAKLQQGMVLGLTTQPDPGFGGLALNANAAVLPAGPTGTLLHAGNLDGVATGLVLDSFGSSPAFIGRRTGGTNAAPTSLANGATFLSLQGQGYNSGYQTSAQLNWAATEAWSAGHQGSQWQFFTTPIGSASMRQVMTLGDGLMIGEYPADMGLGTINAAGSIASAGFIPYGSATTDSGSYGFTNGNGPKMAVWGSTSPGAGTVSFYNAANTEVAHFDSTGNMMIAGGTATKPGGGSWTAPSDRSLKSTVEPWPTGLDAVLSLDVLRYRYTNDTWNLTHTDYVGLDAADAASTIPEMARSFTMPSDPDNPDVPPETVSAVESGPLIYALVNAIKELSARLDLIDGGRGTPEGVPVPVVAAKPPTPAAHTRTRK
jgi:hypothetical protein